MNDSIEDTGNLLSIRSAILGWLLTGFAMAMADGQESKTLLPALESSKLPAALKARVLVEEQNCIACHATGSNDLANASKTAPRLADVASRANPLYLQSFIEDPQRIKPGSTMPHALGGLGQEERSLTASAITHFLTSIAGSSAYRPLPPDAVAAEKGEQLFHTVGCVACHSPRNSEGAETMKGQSVPLGELTSKYNIRSLADFLENPHRVRPSGRMPRLGLQRRDYERISNYLLRETRIPGHLDFTLLRGRVWEGLDVNVERERAGQVDDFELSRFGKLPQNSAVIYEGFLHSNLPGEARFFLKLNGGELWINEKLVVELKPSSRRGVKEIEGRSVLVKGWNRVRLVYIHAGKEPGLKFEMSGPAKQRGPIESKRLANSDKPVAGYQSLQVDPDLADRGKLAFVQHGCVQCHDDVSNRIPKNLLATISNARPLSDLRPGRGCLGPAKGAWPKLSLSEGQKQQVNARLTEIEKEQLSEADRIDKTLVSFQCISCHSRADLGGVSPERNALFTGSKNELGNDGRIPPPLTLVGAKLKKNWLTEVLLRGGRQREYLATRMPQYGESNVGHLIDLFEKVDRVEPVEFEPIRNLADVRKAGHFLIGTDGFSCIACHDFNGQKAAGPGALEIIHTTSRLKKEWFYHFMLKPDRFRKGTIMPASWPGGHVFMEDVLDGDLKKQIESLWVYLEDGTRAKNPTGLSRKSPELRVTDEAVICRGRGTAGYRGLGVGYPERISLAFDTQEMNLRLLWKGEFATVDNGRFFARGRDRVSFPAGIPFHRLKSLDDNWPYKRKTDYLFPRDHGYRFGGYELDKLRRPTFFYEYGSIQVSDFFEDRLDRDQNPYFRRSLSFDSKTDQPEFYFRAASGSKIEKISDRNFRIDRLNLSFDGAERGLVRPGQPMELLIPLRLGKGKSTLNLEYKW